MQPPTDNVFLSLMTDPGLTIFLSLSALNSSSDRLPRREKVMKKLYDFDRNSVIAVFGIPPGEMSSRTRFANTLHSLHLYRNEDERNSIGNNYGQCDVRPRKAVGIPGTSFPSSLNLNPLSSEKVFQERSRSETYPSGRHGAVDFCLDLEWGSGAKEYCQKTSLHGLKYVGDSELNLSERFFWFVTFVLGVLAAAYFITILYNRWNESPMIITLSPKATLLETIPFPAVTICNMNGAKKSVAESIDNNPNNDSEVHFEKHMLRKLCGEATSRNTDKVNASWSKMQKFMIKVSQPCHSMLVACLWRSEPMSCQDLFNPEITDEGMCCSFNKVKRNFIYRNPRQLHGLNYTFPYPGIDWTPESGYPADAPINANPWRVFGAGKGLGLTIILDAELFDYYCSSTASVGFKVLLHSPVETPRLSEFAYFITPGDEARVEITPKISTTTQSLVNIPESKRRCVFSTERNLRFYRTYTQRNCELECQSNFTLKHCKCVPFYLPKDVTTRICGTADDECVEFVRDIAEKRFPEDEVNGTEWDAPRDINCSCLPSCVQIFYTKQMSTGKLEDMFKVRSTYLNGKDQSYYKKNMAVVHFFFVENSFTSFEKGEIFGFTDFLSNTGGLLGLFLGFSFMSAAEIAYFLTMKVFCARMRKNHRTVAMGERFKVLPFAQ